MKYLLKSFLYIPKNEFTSELQNKLIINRPVNNYYSNKDVPDKIVLYELINDKIVRIPRYAFKSISYLKNNNLLKDETPYNSIDINFNSNNFILNYAQEETVSKTYNYLTSDYGAVIVAEPGEGKTLMAINLICKLKVKTLILVHKDFLINQWMTALLKSTDLKKEDIGLLKNGKFIDGKVVIGSQQSLMRKTISNEVNKLFTLKIQDETHRIGAEMFLKSFTRFNTRYTLALSATPHRPDKMEKVYFFHTSNNLVMHENIRSITSSYVPISYMTEMEWIRFPYYVPYRNQIFHNLIRDKARNNLIFKILLRCIKENRKIILLSEFVDILNVYYEIFNKKYKNVKVGRLYGKNTIKENEHYDIVLATYKKAMEGVDIPYLDTLVMLTPIASKVSLKQTIGRIQRFQENKNIPIIFDIIDTKYEFTVKLWHSRVQKYEQWGIAKLDSNTYI